ncbi:MAG TPA: TonB-dependent receptor, partial [Bacteroidales bacterium]|nr:TonB-dependent receptor [Bacteroidales bacterium]
MKKAIIFFTVILISSGLFAQTITRNLQGQVADAQTQQPLPYASIIVLDTDPVIGTASDLDGSFTLENVPVGRQSIRISMIGYETYVANEILISSGNNPTINAKLHPKTAELEGVTVRVRKDEPLNTMATLSSRQFTVEETQRYAGGLNDPARLASSFAGVAIPSITSNGISVRGNSPAGLLWQIEGVEVPNPNHFANLTVTGGGFLTAISNQMMANSDFHTGAFPAEYGNATSGVFDIKLRNGSNTTRSYTLQAGLIGVDFSTEGPFKTGGKSSYLMNYRNSTMALMAPILPENTGILKYQDLAFKTHFPTNKAGTFSFWGIGALDGQEMEAADSIDWEMDADRDNSETGLYMFASGVSHQIRLGTQTFLNSAMAVTGSGLSHEEHRVGYNEEVRPQSDVSNDKYRITAQTNLNHHFSKKHSNRTGIKYSHLGYNINISQAQQEGGLPVTLASQNDNSGLLQFHSQSKLELGNRFTLNAGIHAQWFLLNDSYSVEPRAGLKYQVNPSQSIAFAYGRHSRIEDLKVYF